MMTKSKSDETRASLLECIATSQVFFFVLMADLWFRNLTLNSLVVDPTYWTLHLLQVIKQTTFLDLQ